MVSLFSFGCEIASLFGCRVAEFGPTARRGDEIFHFVLGAARYLVRKVVSSVKYVWKAVHSKFGRQQCVSSSRSHV